MVKEQKLRAVEELKKLIDSNSVFGIIDMHKMPNRQMQEIKKKIRGSATLKMTKKSTLMLALEGANKPGIKELEKMIQSKPAVIFTNMDSFKFFGMVSKLKSPTSAKEGDIAPREISVSAGPTNLMPGPVISEFAKARIPAGVEEGKIAIKKDTVVAKSGDVISKILADILKKLGIEPMEVGMNVVALFENGMIYTKDVLSLVGENYLNKIREAANQALNLSVSISYPTKQNIGYLFSKAYRQAKVIEEKIGGTK